MRRTLKIIVVITFTAACLTSSGCGSVPNANDKVTVSGDEYKDNDTIAVISKSYQNQFYQAAFNGANDAAADLGVNVTTNGPDAESNITQQIEQIEDAISQKPAAIVLAACDPLSLEDTLKDAKNAGIPVICFDAGIPNDESGAVAATVETNNEKAGANAAAHMMENSDFRGAVLGGDVSNPAVIGVIAQDDTSRSITDRVAGYIYEIKNEIESEEGFKDSVEIVGNDRWACSSASSAKVMIRIVVPETTSQEDIQMAVSQLLKTDNMAGIFASNQDAVNALIAATDDGNELNRETGKYRNLVVVGFDAGAAQKKAIREKQFYGSVTQDPYEMGYQAISIAVKAAHDQFVSNVHTGSKWYDADSIDDDDISMLLYD